MIKRVLIKGPHSDDIVGFQNGISRVQHLRLSERIGANGEARVLTEWGGTRDTEKVTVEVDRGGERGSDFEERREREERNRTPVVV